MTGRRWVSRVPALLLGVSLALTACSVSRGAGESGTVLRVVAASSLTESFGALERRFEAEHDDVDVRLSFESSAVLVEQLRQGLGADVLATADTATMTDAVDAGLTGGEPVVVASNTLVIVTPPGNPSGITGLADLGETGYAACVAAAPCGGATRRLLDLNDLDPEPTTEEQNVKAVLTKVLTGQVDAGIVYATDARAAGEEVETVAADKAAAVVSDYPVAVLAEADQPELAARWAELLASSPGQRVLAEHGFAPGG